MIILPLYNMQLISRGNMYFQTDVFKSLAGKVVEGEKVVILQTKRYQTRKELTEDNFYKIGAVGNLTDISPEGYVVVNVTGRINVDEISVDANHDIQLSLSRRNDIDILDEVKEREI